MGWVRIAVALAIGMLTACAGGSTLGDRLIGVLPTGSTYTVVVKQTVVSSASSSADPVTVKEYSVAGLPSAGDITVAEDGSVWWETAPENEAVLARMQGTEISVVPSGVGGSSPGGPMSATQNGRVWAVANVVSVSSQGTPQWDSSIVYATAGMTQAAPSGGFNLGLDNEESNYCGIDAIVPTPDSDIWWSMCNMSVASPGTSFFGAISENATSSESVQSYSARNGNESYTTVLSGPDGDVWIGGSVAIQRGGTLVIGFDRFSPNGSYLSTIRMLGIEYVPIDAVTGPDGAVWFTDFSQNLIGRLTVSGGLTTFSLSGYSGAGDGPWDITVGGDGALWFTDGPAGAVGSVGRITTHGVVTFYDLPTAYPGPEAIAGPVTSPGCGNNDLWVSEANSGKIAEIVTST